MSAGSFAAPGVEEGVDLAARQRDLVVVRSARATTPDDAPGDDDERHEEDERTLHRPPVWPTAGARDGVAPLVGAPGRGRRSTHRAAGGRRWNTFYP